MFPFSFFFFVVVGLKFWVVQSLLKLHSHHTYFMTHPQSSKCQQAQWASRAGHCGTPVQMDTDTSTSAALISSNYLKEHQTGKEGGETATHGRLKDWEREPGCQIGKHLSSISVTTASLTASVAMTTEDCQASWREGRSKKSAAVTYFRREGKWSQCMRCLTAVSLHFNGGDAKQERWDTFNEPIEMWR